jgi:signal transduction histidine kinase
LELRALFATLQRASSETAQQNGVELQVARTAATVMSDAVLLESMLRNLVRNALKYKYTPAGGRVLLGCRPRGSQFRIEVHDTGVGIPGYHLARIFEAFRHIEAYK